MAQWVLLLVVVGLVTANGLALALAVWLTAAWAVCCLVFGPNAPRAVITTAARWLRR